MLRSVSLVTPSHRGGSSSRLGVAACLRGHQRARSRSGGGSAERARRKPSDQGGTVGYLEGPHPPGPSRAEPVVGVRAGSSGVGAAPKHVLIKIACFTQRCWAVTVAHHPRTARRSAGAPVMGSVLPCLRQP